MKSLVLFTMLALVAGMFSSCRKAEKPKAIVTVVDLDGNYVKGATVRVYSSPNGSIVSDEQITNETGQTIHEFNEECILNVKASIVVNNVNLDGTGLVILKEGETYYETITVK